jgi:hypothetical protein
MLLKKSSQNVRSGLRGRRPTQLAAARKSKSKNKKNIKTATLLYLLI